MVHSDNSTYITDLDFVPSNIREGSDYELVYGILLHFHHYAFGKVEYVYNLTCLLCQKQKTQILRRIMAKRWITILKDIINRLDKYAGDESIYVEIPFCEIFYVDVMEIRNAYEFSCSILEELINSDFNNIELANIESKEQLVEVIYPVKSMKELFFDLIEKVKDGYFEFTDMNSVEPDMIYDEMCMRGLCFEPKNENYMENNQYRKYLLGGKIKRDFTYVVDEDDNFEEVVLKRKDFQILGPIYYMLRDALSDNEELLIKVASFAANSKFDINSKAKTTAYKYFRSPDSFFLNKIDKVQYIREQLDKYGCNIPDELN